MLIASYVYPLLGPPAIMLGVLPTIKCCIAQNFAYYALISFIPQFPCFVIKFVLHGLQLSEAQTLNPFTVKYIHFNLLNQLPDCSIKLTDCTIRVYRPFPCCNNSSHYTSIMLNTFRHLLCSGCSMELTSYVTSLEMKNLFVYL